MSNQIEKNDRVANVSTTTRCIWVTMEASEVIELKRIAIDRDVDGAVTFFNEVLCPRVKIAAAQRNVALDVLLEGKSNEHISG